MGLDRKWFLNLTKRWHSIAFWIGLAGLVLVILNYLWTQHRSHLWVALPFLILLACPLLHLFHHKGHGGGQGGGHGSHSHGEDEDRRKHGGSL